MKKPTNMKLFYNEEKEALGIEWTYSITKYTPKTKIPSNKTQYIINLHNMILTLGNIRRVLFLYEQNNEYFLSTTEPENNIKYETILTRNNKIQTTIQLPQEFLNLKKTKSQIAKITLYPKLKDPLAEETPRMTITIIDNEEKEEEPDIFMKDEILYLKWTVTPNEKLSEQMKSFLPKDIIEELEKILVPRQVIINTKTLDYEVQSTIQREEEQ